MKEAPKTELVHYTDLYSYIGGGYNYYANSIRLSQCAFSLILKFILIVSCLMFAGNMFGQSLSLGGSGTSDDPYMIHSSAEIETLASYVASNGVTADTYFKVADDYSGGTATTPIGTSSNPFCGNFDGNGKVIDITRTVSTEKNGLFGSVGEGANIHDVKVTGKITLSVQKNFIGGIVGYAEGTDGNHVKVTDCSSSVEIIGGKASRSGGIAGYIKYADITNCHNEGASNSYQFVGGIVGMVYFSSIINCTNSGSLVATNSASNIGGICGSASVDATKVQSFISSCTNSGTISGGGSAGGILGYSSGQNKGLVEVSNCTNKGAVTGTSGSIGGIIGNDNGYTYIANCTNKGDVTGTSTSIGGIVGNDKGYTDIANCNNLGSVTGKNYVGGIIGCSDHNTARSIIEDCYNSGDIKATATTNVTGAGGVIGYIKCNEPYRNIVSRCTNSGKISSISTYNVGGVIGYATYTDISQCSNTGIVTTSSNSVGGVIGRANNCTTDQCSNTGAVTSSSYDIGGVVGFLYNTPLLNSYNRGAVTTTIVSTSTTNAIGGIVGQTSAASIVYNCYNTGIVSASNTTQFCVGGVVGRMYNGEVRNCYNGGTIELDVDNTGYSGNIIGGKDGSVNIQYCYYRTNMGAETRIQGTSGTAATVSNCKAFNHPSESDATCTLVTRNSNDLVDALNYWRTDISGNASLYLEWYDDTEASGWNNLGMPEFLDNTTLLPIELTSFSATCDGHSSIVEWTTATEHNNDYFMLERSDDAINFTEIARVAGAGNSIEPLNYNYIDYDAHSGNNYYRLWQVDYDGTHTVSEIIVANCIAETYDNPDVLVFPNPFNGNLSVQMLNFGEKAVSIMVYDMFGRLVMDKEINTTGSETEITLDFIGLPDAAYNVRVSTADYVINRLVVKQ